MSFILIVVLYSGPVFMTEYNTKSDCENSLIKQWDNGNMKKIKSLECVEND